jgi:glycosyltransferase involved in cell wall biosynthesis
MTRKQDQGTLSVLHVLTLNTRNGEYGGPVRVARETCTELKLMGHDVKIFSGTLKNLEPDVILDLNESYVRVSPIWSKYPISSLWSWHIIPELYRKIRDSDIVHIHFARDLVSLFAAIICLFQRKRFVTQTHGMVVSDSRYLIKMLDRIFIVPVLARSSVNFVLNEFERNRIVEISNRFNLKILANGISTSNYYKSNRTRNHLMVAFCSRLHPQKGVEKFLELATSQKNNDIEFQIFGTDGGDLWKVKNYLNLENRNHRVSYLGHLPPSEVIRTISEIDVLILPSFNENFPMIILEALSVGTCVLVMPSCGISNTLTLLNPDFVSEDESTDGLVRTFERLKNYVDDIKRDSIINFCLNNFSIKKVCEELACTYYAILERDDR